MPTLEEIRAAFAGDPFTREAIGPTIELAEPGRAVCSMQLEPRHYNVAGIPHGGAIFTLGDFAFGVAANAFADRVTISLQHDITYLSPARGKTVTAEAVCVKPGRTVSLYTVTITDDLGTNVAFMSVNGFTTMQRIGGTPPSN